MRLHSSPQWMRLHNSPPFMVVSLLKPHAMYHNCSPQQSRKSGPLNKFFKKFQKFWLKKHKGTDTPSELPNYAGVAHRKHGDWRDNTWETTEEVNAVNFLHSPETIPYSETFKPLPHQGTWILTTLNPFPWNTRKTMIIHMQTFEYFGSVHSPQ